jgi:hypothetical protein
MAKWPIILDNRVHRTIRISTAAAEYPLVPASPYKVLLTIIGGKDNLVISKPGMTTITLPCTKTFTPPACPSPVSSVNNASCQWNLQVDDSLYRIIELQQNLIDPTTGTVMVVASTSASFPPTITNTLLVHVPGLVTPMDDGGFKVPPDLG